MVSPDTAFTYRVNLYWFAIPCWSLLIIWGRGVSGEPEIVKSISPKVSNTKEEFSVEATLSPGSIALLPRVPVSDP